MDHYRIKMGHLRRRKKAEPDEGTTITKRQGRELFADAWHLIDAMENLGSLKKNEDCFQNSFSKGCSLMFKYTVQ